MANDPPSRPGSTLLAGVLFLMAVATVAMFALFPRFAAYRDHPVWTAVAAAAAAAVAFHPRLAAVPKAIGRIVMAPSPIRFGWFLFVAGTLFCSLCSWWLFHGVPVLDDDTAALFQAKIFLSGRLTVPSPPNPQFFTNFGILSGVYGLPRLCGMYPLGHPLVLLPGLALGVPWLVMPLFGGGLCALTASVGRILFGERTARLAGLACLASPMFAEVCSTHLNHAPTAFGVLLAFRGVLLALRDPRFAFGLQAGAGLSLTFLCRPSAAAALGVALGAGAILFAPRRTWKARWPLAVAACLVAGAVVLHTAFTQCQTGDWRVPGHQLCMGSRGFYGFSRRFGPDDAVRNAVRRAAEWAVKSTGWPVAAVLPALLPFFRRGWRRRALWLWFAPAALSLLHFFFWYYEICMPGRYLFSALPAVLLLSSAGWTLAADALGVPLARLVLAPAACSLFVFLPVHLSSFDDHFWDVEKTLPRVVEKAGIRNAVVLYETVGWSPDRGGEDNEYYATAFMRNDPDFSGDVVYAKSGPNGTAALARAFPGRARYLYRYRRDLNLSELYRDTGPADGSAPVYEFVPVDAPRCVDPATVPPSLPGPEGRNSSGSAR